MNFPPMPAEIVMPWKTFFVVLVFLLERHLSGSDPIFPDTCVTLDGKKTCYSSDAYPYRKYGSKTPYPAVYDDYTRSYDLVGCVPKVFYLLSRHSTRYPDKDYIKYINSKLPDLQTKILESYKRGDAKLCEDDIDKIMAWSPTIDVKDQKQLSDTGAAEAEDLGKRMKGRFPQLLGMPYSPESYEIAFTSKSRTKDTAENFTLGLFTEQEYRKINFSGKINDTLLLFHKNCKQIMKKCEHLPLDLEEMDKFMNGTLMEKTLQGISKRIGFNVTSDDLMHLYIACTFGYALNISDAWCTVFSHDNLKVIEYAHDVEDYYKRSYGNKVNAEQACPIISYIIHLFKSYENTKRNKVALHFSHAGALSRVFAALGMFKDDKMLTTDDFCALNTRKWRSTNVIPFNTNLIFVLYNCTGSLKFLTLHNEKPIAVAGCETDKLCSLEKFYKEFNSTNKHCNLNKICGNCKR